MSEQNPARKIRRVAIYRDPDRERDAANERDITAYGVEFPSGEIVVEWNREAFEIGDRTETPTHSHYGSLPDAEQASGGTVVYIDPLPRGSFQNAMDFLELRESEE